MEDHPRHDISIIDTSQQKDEDIEGSPMEETKDSIKSSGVAPVENYNSIKTLLNAKVKVSDDGRLISPIKLDSTIEQNEGDQAEFGMLSFNFGTNKILYVFTSFIDLAIYLVDKGITIAFMKGGYSKATERPSTFSFLLSRLVISKPIFSCLMPQACIYVYRIFLSPVHILKFNRKSMMF